MLSITMSNTPQTIIHIPKEMNKIEATHFIKEKCAENPQSVTVFDFSLASHILSRDFLFVITKRIPADTIKFIVSHDHERVLVEGFRVPVELKWVHAEFDKAFPKTNILAHNMTMWEYFLYEVKRGFSYVFFFFFKKTNAKEKIVYMKNRMDSSLVLMIAGLIVSFTLLLFIFHFAVSKTFIYISPQITVKPISANIIYSNSSSGSILQSRNVIPLKKITLSVNHSMNFTLDTVDPNSTRNAEGRVTLYNELDTAQSLKPFTRLVTESGEVFRTKEWVNIPASKTLNWITEIGSAETIVIADLYDESGKIIGKRGNISAWTDLIIPWLKFNRDKVYAKTKENFTTGSDPKIHIVNEAEVKKFQWILKEQLVRVARDTIQNELTQNKEKLWEDYSLLMGEGISFTGETIEMAGWKKYWDSADEVTLNGRITVSALVFDRKQTIEYLTKIFREWLLHGTDKELAIHPETLRVANLVSREEKENDIRIKATMEMNASITYDFENSSNQLVRHMKVLIAWLSKNDAISRLINDGHVKDIDISFSPFWIRQVSSNIDNIEFIIKK